LKSSSDARASKPTNATKGLASGGDRVYFTAKSGKLIELKIYEHKENKPSSRRSDRSAGLAAEKEMSEP
jgi:hypothetical protein